MNVPIKIAVLSFCLIFCAVPVSAQKMDSLKIALKNAKQDTTRCSILFDMIGVEENDTLWPKYNESLKNITEKNLKTNLIPEVRKKYLKYYADVFNNLGYLHYQKSEFKPAFDCWKKALSLQEEIGDTEGSAYTLNNMGAGYEGQGDIIKALDCFEKSIKIHEASGNKEAANRTLNNIGVIYVHQGNIPKGLECFSRSLKLQEQLDDKSGMASSLNNIAKIYHDQGDLVLTMQYYKKAAALNEQVGNKQALANLYNSMGSLYNEQGETKAGFEYLKKALKLNEEIGDKVGIAASLINMGTALQAEGKEEEALEDFEKSLVLNEETGDKKGISLSLEKLGLLYLKKQDYSRALDVSLRNLKISREIEIAERIRDAAKLLKSVYAKKNQPVKELEMYELYIQMRDSLSNKEIRKASLRTQFQYEYDKKETIIKAQQEKDRAIAKEKDERQKFIIGSVIVGLILVIIFSVFIFNRLQVTRKQKQIIEKQKQIVEEHRKEVLDSINYAKRIQFALLASNTLLDKHLPEHFVLFKPKDVVSGDFYWATPVEDGFIYITADCTGHGVPGAFMSLLNITKLSQIINENKITQPDLILNQLRTEIIKVLNPEGSKEESKDGMDAVICKLNVKKMKLEYAAANNSFYIIRDGKIIHCAADKMPVGKGHDDTLTFTKHEITLEQGDLIYTFSDGYADQFGGLKSKKFKYKQLEELLLTISEKPLRDQKRYLDKAFEDWKGVLEQVDDVCILGVKV